MKRYTIAKSILILTKRVLVTCLTLFIVSCTKDTGSKNDANGNDNTKKSAADLIAGIYTGDGKYLPDGVSLGNYTSCIVPPTLESTFKKGTATVNIIKLTDSTVKVIFSGTVFPTTTIAVWGVTLNNSNTEVSLSSGSFLGTLLRSGSYDITTKFLTFTNTLGTGDDYLIPGGSASDCKIGYPYYLGYDFRPSNGNYQYVTIRHLDFTGTKQ